MSLSGGHWYRPDGAPFYEVASRDGHLRPVTLRDARKVGAVPSVTTVTRIVSAPQLAAWQVRQGVLAALTLPRIEGETDESLLDRIKADGEAQAQAAADEGTRIHDALDLAWRNERVPVAYTQHVAAVTRVIAEAFPGVADWVSEKSFAHPDGFGGRADLHSPSTGIVIDYKGKDGDFSDGKRLAYDQHWQLGAYQRGLGLRRAKCANVFVSRTHPGAVKLHVWSEAEVAGGEAIFLAALRLWQAVHDYRPEFSAVAVRAARAS